MRFNIEKYDELSWSEREKLNATAGFHDITPTTNGFQFSRSIYLVPRGKKREKWLCIKMNVSDTDGEISWTINTFRNKANVLECDFTVEAMTFVARAIESLIADGMIMCRQSPYPRTEKSTLDFIDIPLVEPPLLLSELQDLLDSHRDTPDEQERMLVNK